MAIKLQLRNGTIQEWELANPTLAEGEVGVVLEPSGGLVIGDGTRTYKELPFKPWAQDAYDILVTYGGYKGTKDDFCRQLNVHLKTPEQQAGQLVNAGAGWNSYSFMKEFSEDVYVLLTPQAATVFASVRNITKQGFHYCLYDANGDTVSGNVVVNYLAVAVSELNMAQAIAAAAGLNPFDFDNLTALFADHAAEVVGNEAAFNLTKRSGMAAGRYICHLTGLNPVAYHNVVSIAGDETAMNTIAVTDEAVTFVVMSPGAYDGIRLSTMAMGKYLAGILSISPNGYLSVTDLLNDEAALTALVVDQTAMQALSGSEIASKEMAAFEIAMTSIASSDVARNAIQTNSLSWKVVTDTDAFITKFAVGSLKDVAYNPSDFGNMDAVIAHPSAVTALSASEIAMTALSASRIARNSLLNNSLSWKVVADSNVFIAKYAIGCLENSSYKPENFANMSAIVSNSAALAALASSSTAMSALASSSTAYNALLNSSLLRSTTKSGDNWTEGTVITGKGIAVDIYGASISGGDGWVKTDNVSTSFSANNTTTKIMKSYMSSLSWRVYKSGSILKYIQL